MVGEQCPQPFDVIAPVTVQLAGHAEPGHQLRPCRLHAPPGRVTGQLIEGAGGVGDDKYLKALLQRRQRREGHAHFSDHTGDQQLLLAGGFYRFDEVLVVPSVDVAGACDVRGVGELLFQFRHQRAVGAGLETGGENGRQLEVLGQVRQGQDVVLEAVGVDVPYQRQQTGLVVDQQHGGVVLVQTLVLEGHDGSPSLAGWDYQRRQG
ncbi:hypothetical protein D3C77_550160 [compost metagenome]